MVSSGRFKMLRIEKELFEAQREVLTCWKGETSLALDAILLVRCGYLGRVKNCSTEIRKDPLDLIEDMVAADS